MSAGRPAGMLRGIPLLIFVVQPDSVCAIREVQHNQAVDLDFVQKLHIKGRLYFTFPERVRKRSFPLRGNSAPARIDQVEISVSTVLQDNFI